MTEWANRIRICSASYTKGEGWFNFRGEFESREQYEQARLYVENVINAGMKPDILDAIRAEAEDTDAALKREQEEHRITKLALEIALEKLEAIEPPFLALCQSLGIPLPAPYNQTEDPHGK